MNTVVGFSSRWVRSATLAVLAAAPGIAHTAPWTAVGASGLIDNNDLGLYLTDNATGLLAFRGGTAVGTLNVKYNIVNVDGFAANSLKVRFRDNGGSAQVILQLRQYGIDSGVTSDSRLTFVSDWYSPSDSFQTRLVCINPGFSFDFNEYAYFINAFVTKTSSTGTPAIGSMKLGTEILCAPSGKQAAKQ